MLHLNQTFLTHSRNFDFTLYKAPKQIFLFKIFCDLFTFRLFTNTGELICLQTKGFLEYNKETKKIDSFLCINTLIKEEDEARYLNEQKEKFTPYISELQNSSHMVRQALSIKPKTHCSTCAETLGIGRSFRTKGA